MKLLIILSSIILLIKLSQGVESPEEWSEKTYDFVHKFKGNKQQFFAAMTKRLMDEMKTIKPGTMNVETAKKGVDLVAAKLTKDDVVSAAEFKGFFDKMLKAFPIPH